MAETTCISCSTDTDLVSVHDELIFDGTEALGTRNSAASLAKYCFNFKIEKLDDEQYEICSTCLGLLIQASTYKEQIMRNMNSSKNTQDAERKLLFTELSEQDILRAKRNALWNEVIVNRCKTIFDIRKLDFAGIKTAATDLASDTLKKVTEHLILESSAPKSSNAKSTKSKTPIRKTRVLQRLKRKIETPKSVNKIIRDEFFALHRDCKDFYLFSWNQSKFNCTICRESYGDVNEFKTHVRKHTMEQSENVFPSKGIYRGPDLKLDVSTMKCRYCDVRLTDFEEFRDHLSDAHEIDSDYLFSRIFPFILNKEEYRCGICGEVFVTFGNLNMHMNQHSTNHKCNTCKKPFASLHRLQAHILRSHLPGMFRCTKCDEQFDTAGKRENHMSSVHRKSMHLCPHCPEKFKSYNYKLRHLSEAHNEEAKKYQCDTCQMKFLSSTNRSLHVRKVHLRERNHVCGDCGQAFFKRNNLKDHMTMHTGERSHVCDICDKAFGRYKTLSAHKKTHIVNKVRYGCEFCKREYSCRGSLTVHLSTCKNKNKIE